MEREQGSGPERPWAHRLSQAHLGHGCLQKNHEWKRGTHQKRASAKDKKKEPLGVGETDLQYNPITSPGWVAQ